MYEAYDQSQHWQTACKCHKDIAEVFLLQVIECLYCIAPTLKCAVCSWMCIISSLVNISAYPLCSKDCSVGCPQSSICEIMTEFHLKLVLGIYALYEIHFSLYCKQHPYFTQGSILTFRLYKNLVYRISTLLWSTSFCTKCLLKYYKKISLCALMILLLLMCS